MKILIFEYITGGGLAKQPLPEALACEGDMMARALIDDLLAINAIELVVTRDYRLPLDEVFNPDQLEIINITPNSNVDMLLVHLARHCDAIWPIAPETDDTLYNLCRLIEATSTALLSSQSQLVKMLGNKLATYQHFKTSNIPVVETYRASQYQALSHLHPNWVVKPIDGVGCEGIEMIKQPPEVSDQLIIQPFVEGRSLSLSCLFSAGEGRLVCVNEQLVERDQNQFKLQACRINIDIEKPVYVELVAQIAQALPMLLGYIGIDLIETEQGPLVLEINPRLTTSYVGIKSALGINIGAYVIDLLNKKPALEMTCNRQILINIPKTQSHD